MTKTIIGIMLVVIALWHLIFFIEEYKYTMNMNTLMVEEMEEQTELIKILLLR